MEPPGQSPSSQQHATSPGHSGPCGSGTQLPGSSPGPPCARHTRPSPQSRSLVQQPSGNSWQAPGFVPTKHTLPQAQKVAPTQAAPPQSSEA